MGIQRAFHRLRNLKTASRVEWVRENHLAGSGAFCRDRISAALVGLRWIRWAHESEEMRRRCFLPRTVPVTPPRGVSLKCPVCFVVGSRRLIIKSRLDPPACIWDISDPSQSRPLLGQAPGGANRRFCRPCHFFLPGNVVSW